jgi:hypothetical protein
MRMKGTRMELRANLKSPFRTVLETGIVPKLTPGSNRPDRPVPPSPEEISLQSSQLTRNRNDPSSTNAGFGHLIV